MIKNYGILYSVDNHNIAITTTGSDVVNIDDINDWIIISKIGLIVIGYDVVGVDDYE
jgi:hypothetical protein